MSTTEPSTGTTSPTASTADVEMKLEVVVIPVTDVDRAKAFYAGLGWRLDADFADEQGFRIVQFTPPGSGCSIQFGAERHDGAARLGDERIPDRGGHPGRARRARRPRDRGSEVFHEGALGDRFHPEPAWRAARRRCDYGSFASFSDPDGNTWLFQEITSRLPGRIDVGVTSFGVHRGARERAPARRGRPRRARDADRRGRRELARLVRGVHRRGAGRDRAAGVNVSAAVTQARDAGRLVARVPAQPDRRGADRRDGVRVRRRLLRRVRRQRRGPGDRRHFGAGVAAIQWTLTSYLLAVAALLLIAGALADRFGRRRVLVIGLGVMGVASVLCAVASSVETLIAARAVQGIGAAFVVPTSLALLNGTLRPADRARGIGIWAGLSTLATTAGPYAGGWLVDHASWRWVFLLNLPLIVLALVALRRVPETSGARRSLSFDAIGALLAVLGLGGVVYALTDGAQAGWTSPRILLALVVGVLALVGTGAGRAAAARADAAAVAVRVAPVRRDQRGDAPVLRRAHRGGLPARGRPPAAPGLHGDAGGGGADPGDARLPRARAAQRHARRAHRAALADGRRNRARRRVPGLAGRARTTAPATCRPSSRRRSCAASGSGWP